MLDSGAEMTVSGIKSDFVSLSPYPNVSLCGVDGKVDNGKPCAYRGILKRSNLRLATAVYYPKLGEERLISMKKLVEDGWIIEMRDSNSEARNPKYGEHV